MKHTVMRLARYIRVYRWQYAAVCAAGVTIAFLEMIPPKLVGHAVNLMSSGHANWSAVWTTAALWTGIFVTIQLLHSSQIYLANAYGERILSKIRLDMFTHLQRLPVAYFEKTHIGRILSIHSSDIDSVRNTLIWGLNTLVANATIMVLAALMILITDWKLFLAVIWLVPTTTFISFLYSDKIGKAWREVRTHSTRVSASQAENIAGMRVVAAFNRQDINLEEFGKLQDENTRQNIRACALSGVFQPLLQWVRFGGQGIILLYGGYRVARGDLLPGNVVAVAMYWEWFMQPAIGFGSFFNDLLIAGAGAERIFAFLDEPGVKEVARAREISSARGHVRFENVTFGYDKDRPVLNNVDFDISPGKTVAIVGTSGSGKTTLMSLLARFYEPQHGRILLDGQDIRTIAVDSLRTQIAVVPQNCFLFSGSVMENLKYGASVTTDEEVVEAARTLGCHERFESLRDGYDTEVGERGSALSAGERQLICFTRALLSGAKVLLLDEATSAIDPATELQVQYALKSLVSRRTTFIVAHRLSTVEHADTILVMEKGKIAERGNHRQLIEAGGLYAKLQAAHDEVESDLIGQFA